MSQTSLATETQATHGPKILTTGILEKSSWWVFSPTNKKIVLTRGKQHVLLDLGRILNY